jgi:hypothetical protein
LWEGPIEVRTGSWAASAARVRGTWFTSDCRLAATRKVGSLGPTAVVMRIYEGGVHVPAFCMRMKEPRSPERYCWHDTSHLIIPWEVTWRADGKYASVDSWGTQFLGRAVAASACAVGHVVTCAARGVTGPVAPDARFVRIDRDGPDGLAPLADQEFDAAVDLSRHPGQVRRAVAAFKLQNMHWTFVSTVSVYSDNHRPSQRADTAPSRAARTGDRGQ